MSSSLNSVFGNACLIAVFRSVDVFASGTIGSSFCFADAVSFDAISDCLTEIAVTAAERETDTPNTSARITLVTIGRL